MKTWKSLLWMETSVTSIKAYGLGDPQPQGILLSETAISQGKKLSPQSCKTSESHCREARPGAHH